MVEVEQIGLASLIIHLLILAEAQEFMEEVMVLTTIMVLILKEQKELLIQEGEGAEVIIQQGEKAVQV
ncbi:MAG: hypothetical protein EBU84_20780 [Actinobacteria bacterium]|nr:hypothetical protein [Actinomycetota bacterium]